MASCSTTPLPRCRAAALSFVMEWIAARVTDVFLTVSEAEALDARRLHIARRAEPVRNGRDPTIFRPDPTARARIRSELGVPDDRVVIIAVSRLVWHKGYPELAAAMRSVPEAELWVVGERLDSDRGADMVALLRSAGLGRPPAHAGLSHRHPSAAGRRRHLHPAQPLRGPADVGDRGDADRPARRRHQRSRPGRAGGRRRYRSSGSIRRPRCAGFGLRQAGPRPRACAPGWARPADNGRWTATTRPRSSREPWTCSASRFIPPRLQHTGPPP